MPIKQLLVSSLSLVLLACGAAVADAQTGPAGAQQKQGGAQTKLLTAEHAAAMLNAKVESGPNGAKIIKTSLKIDGWQYDIVLVFPSHGQSFDIISPLTGPKANLTPGQMQGLKQKNTELAAKKMAFAVDNQTGMIYFDNWEWQTALTDQQFGNVLAEHCSIIRNNYDLWKQQ
jgi:hypothetical protein